MQGKASGFGVRGEIMLRGWAKISCAVISVSVAVAQLKTMMRTVCASALVGRGLLHSSMLRWQRFPQIPLENGGQVSAPFSQIRQAVN